MRVFAQNLVILRPKTEKKVSLHERISTKVWLQP